MILSFSCNDVCCYLSEISLPTCLILSDKHIRGVSTETGPDAWLDRLPSENDEIRRRQPSRHSQADRHHGCALVGGVVVGAKGKYLQSKCCESCFQSKRFWLPILALTPIFGSQKLTNYYCFTQYGTEKEGSVSDSEYKVTQFCLSFSSRETWEEQFVTPREPRILQIWSQAVSSSGQCTLHLHFHLLTSLLCYVSSRCI